MEARRERRKGGHVQEAQGSPNWGRMLQAPPFGALCAVRQHVSFVFVRKTESTATPEALAASAAATAATAQPFQVTGPGSVSLAADAPAQQARAPKKKSKWGIVRKATFGLKRNMSQVGADLLGQKQ